MRRPIGCLTAAGRTTRLPSAAASIEARRVKTVRCKEYDGVPLKDGRKGTVVGVFPDGVYLADIDYPQKRLHEIEDTTEFIREADIEKITYVFA